MCIGFKYGIMEKMLYRLLSYRVMFDLSTTLTKVSILVILRATTAVHHAYIMTNSADIPKVREWWKPLVQSKFRYAAPAWLDDVPPEGAGVELAGGGCDDDNGGAGWVVRDDVCGGGARVSDVDVVVGVDDVEVVVLVVVVIFGRGALDDDTGGGWVVLTQVWSGPH
jgi:hypothetical protein